MKSTNKLRLLLILAIFCQSFQIFAQDYDFKGHDILVNPPHLNICGAPDTISVSVQNVTGGAALTGVQLEIDGKDIPLNIVGVVSAAHISTFTISADSNATLSLTDIPNGVSRTIHFLVEAKCGASTYSPLRYEYTLDYTVSGTAKTAIENGSLLSTGIRKPSLQLAAVGTVDHINSTVGNTYTRTWRVSNTGIGSQLDTFIYKALLEKNLTLQSLQVQIGNGATTTVAPTIVSGTRDTVTYRLETQLRELLNFPGDTITFIETFKIDKCTDDAGSEQSTISVSWGCFDSPTCESSSRSANTTVYVGVPAVQNVKTLSENYLGSKCPGDTLNHAGYFRSTGTGTAKLNYLRMYDNNRTTTSIINNSMCFRRSVDSAWQVLPAPTGLSYNSFYLPATHCNVSYPNTDSATSMYWYFSDEYLAPGDTIYYKFQTKSCPFIGCYSGRYNTHGTKVTRLYVRNACGSGSYSSNVPLSSGRNVLTQSYFGSAPLDVNSGDTVKISLSHYSSITGVGLGAGRYVAADLEVPKGFCPVGDSAVWNAYGYKRVEWDTATNILTLYYDGRVSTFGRMYATRFLKFDCSKPGAVVGTATFRYRVRINPKYTCTADDGEAFECWKSFTLKTHCPGITKGTCPGGPIPYGFDSKRTSYYYSKPDHDDNGSASGTTIDTAKTWTKVITLGDTMAFLSPFVIKGGTGSLPAAWNHMYQNVSITGSAVNVAQTLDYIKPAGNLLKIWDKSTGTAHTCVDTRTYGARTANIKTDMSADTLIAMGCVPAGFRFEDGDSCYLEQYMVMDSFKNERYAGGPLGTLLTASLYNTTVPDGSGVTHYGCDAYRGSMSVVQKNIGSRGGPSSIYCNSTAVSMSNSTERSIHYDLFPNEWHKNVYIDSFHVKLSGAISLRGYEHLDTTADGYTVFRTVRGGKAGQESVNERGSLASSINIYKECSGQGFTHSRTYYSCPPLNKTYVSTERGGSQVNTTAFEMKLDMASSITNTADDKVADWTVQIENTSSTTALPNIWLGYEAYNGTIHVDSIRDVSADTLLAKNNDVWHYGSIPKLTYRQFKVYASYDACALDSLHIYAGWNCDPLDSLNGDRCYIDNVDGYLSPLNAELQIANSIRPTAPVDLCDTFAYEYKVAQVDPAATYNNVFRMNMPPNTTIIPDSTYVMYPDSTNKVFVNFQHLGGNSYGFNVDTIVGLEAFGLRPVAEYPNNTFRVGMQAKAECDYISGDLFEAQVDGEEACENRVRTAYNNSAVAITAAAALPAKTYIPRIDSVAIDACGIPTQLSLKMYNFSGTTAAAATGADDWVYVQLPKHINYDALSASFTKNAPATAEPVVNTTILPGRQRLEWKMAAGIAGNDSMTWTIDVVANKDSLLCGNGDMQMQTLSKLPATCGGTTCEIGKLSRRAEQTFDIGKGDIRPVGSPTISILSDTANALLLDTLVLDIDIANTGLAATGQLKFDFYNDIDFSDGFSAGDDSVTSVTSVTYNVQPGDTLKLRNRIPITRGSAACNLTMLVTKQCDCKGDSLSYVVPCLIQALPVSWLEFMAELDMDDVAHLNWSTASESNNRQFDVLRSIDDTETFQKVGEVAGGGTSDQVRSYYFKDDVSGIPNGVIYYKLRQVDYNDENSESDIRLVNKDGIPQNQMTVYPSPATDYVEIRANGIQGKSVRVEMANIVGQQILLVDDIQVTRGRVSERIDFYSKLKAGYYLITLTDGESTHTQKILIE